MKLYIIKSKCEVGGGDPSGYAGVYAKIDNVLEGIYFDIGKEFIEKFQYLKERGDEDFRKNVDFGMQTLGEYAFKRVSAIEVELDKDITHEKDITESIEKQIKMIEKLKETKTVVTHFGDDLDNKSSIYAIEKWASEMRILAEGEHLKVERVPAGQVKEGFLNVDTGGHTGSRIEGDTIVIDGNPAEGIHSAAAELGRLGIDIPAQIVELADTVPNRVNPLESRTALSLLREATGEQIFAVAEAGLLDKQLTDEQLEEFGLVEAHQKQQQVIDNAVTKCKSNEVTLPSGEKMVLAREQILGGSAIAYELGYNYFASVSKHFDSERNEDGVTFAINAKPGVKLPEAVIEWGKELVEKYRIDERTSGVFLNPNGQMLVAGGPKNPNFKIENETAETFAEKIKSVFGVGYAISFNDIEKGLEENKKNQSYGEE